MFEHLPLPLWDETLTSWVYRASLAKSERGRHLRRSLIACDGTTCRKLFCDVGYYSDEPHVFKKDFDFEHSEMADVACYVSNLNTTYFRRYFDASQEDVTPWDYRTLYCPACLEKDIQDVGYPSWRKSWCYGTSAYCNVHGGLLKKLPDREVSHNRAWEAFKYHSTESQAPPHRQGWFSPYGSAYRDRLAQRVQVWMQSLALQAHVLLPGMADSVPARSVKIAAHAIYSILLKQKTRFSVGGFAKTLVRTRKSEVSALNKTLADRLKLGLYESAPYERMCALLLIGILFGVIKESESARLVALANAAQSQWPTNPKRIGQHSMDFNNLEEYALVKAMFHGVDRRVMEHISGFIDGMESNTLSMRELRSTKAALNSSGRAMWERWLMMP
ncbi:TniQ family protein [Pseudomonas corrugata]|uniref:TniQ family protein n=1 Tax=Pseudomonas corrugata TaxID=47879 RepID=UPI0004BC1B4B|nr:TniQ family protein [Pseudomonas corrugata]